VAGEESGIDAFLSQPLTARIATNGPTVRPTWFLWEDQACQPQIPVVGWLRVALPVAEVAAVQVRGHGQEGNVDGGKVVANQRGSQLSVTEPSAAPIFSATWVSGQRNPFAAKMRLSPATAAPARAAPRPVRLAAPAYSTYAMQDSIENHASVCAALMRVRGTSLRPRVRVGRAGSVRVRPRQGLHGGGIAGRAIPAPVRPCILALIRALARCPSW
jgi:hypothetical protein